MIIVNNVVLKKSLIALALGFFCIHNVVAGDTLAIKLESPISSVLEGSIKRAFGTEYKIDQVPVESGAYFQRIITSYNAHMRHAIMSWLKSEMTTGSSYTKELYYLLNQVDSITTAKQGMLSLARAESAYKSMRDAELDYQEEGAWQERGYGIIALKSSVVLVNIVRDQLLLTLSEIHDSLAYWREQQHRPVKYFFHKSPTKWIMGKKQTNEIAYNIKKLEKLEYAVRSVLGRLTKHVYAFDVQGDMDSSYDWLERLISILVCVDRDQEKIGGYEYRFEKIADLIRIKLSCVNNLKKSLMSKVSYAVKPGHFSRNWLVYSGIAAGAYCARNYYQHNTKLVDDLISAKAFKGYAEQIKCYTQQNIVAPLQDTASAIFIGQSGVADQEKTIEITRAELVKTLDELATPIQGWTGSYGLVKGQPLSDAEKNNILEQEKIGNIDPLLDLLYRIDKNGFSILNKSVEPTIQVLLVYLDLLGYHKTHGVAEQLRVTKNFTILVPFIIGMSVVSGGMAKLYKSFTARDYTVIRLGLLDINSLFIESARPLTDHDYGKLIYLLQNLKSEAMHSLPVGNMRSEFVRDLAKLESHKFDVETKRNIVNNMFMKYNFLTSNIKSA